jgi:diguanylate cyclase (GGDEF)-like protein
MARTAESVGERDCRCADEINQVTGRLKKIATLEDLSEIRTSLEASAAELKTSIDRMAAEGKAAREELRGEVTRYRARLEEAERIASSDPLTGLRSRLWLENYLERRVAEGRAFCVVVVDIDDFKRVNDEHGHPVGDELLQQFATELKSACGTNDIAGRWGGDEFIVLLDCRLSDAASRTSRMREWICGNYTVRRGSGPLKLAVSASFGLAEHGSGETSKELVARADACMYAQKAESRSDRRHAGR